MVYYKKDTFFTGIMMNFCVEILDSVKQLNCQLQENSNRLKAEAEEAQKMSNLISTLLSYIEKGWPIHFVNLVDKEAKMLQKLRNDGIAQIQRLDEAYRQAKEESDRLMRRYPTVFDEACKSARISLDTNSHHPQYSIKNGFFRVEINESTRVAKLSDLGGKLAELPADVDAVTEKIRNEYIRVFDRRFNGPKFLKKIRAQYKKIIKREHLNEGDSVPIKEIAKSLKREDKDFRMDEFVVDLSKLAEKGPYEVDGKVLDLQQTKDTKQGVFIIGADSRGYIGYIVFKEK